MKWSDGSYFTGLWRVDMRFKGSMKMPDGITYEGGFQDDKYHGKGKLIMRGHGRNSNGQ